MSFNKYDFFKDYYYREIEKKNHIVNSLPIPIGIMTLASGFLFHLIEKYMEKNDFYIEMIFLNPFLMSSFVFFMFIIIGFGFALMAAYGQPYKYLVNPKIIEKYCEELNEYCIKNYIFKCLLFKNTIKWFSTYIPDFQKDINSENEIKKSMVIFLDKSYIEATEINYQFNYKKSAYMHKAYGFIRLALIFLFISGIIYLSGNIKNNISHEDLTMPTQISHQPQNNNEPKIPMVEPVVFKPLLQKPQPPEGTLTIREGEIPKKR